MNEQEKNLQLSETEAVVDELLEKYINLTQKED